MEIHSFKELFASDRKTRLVSWQFSEELASLLYARVNAHGDFAHWPHPAKIYYACYDLGFQVGDLTDDLRARFHLDPATQGPVVIDVVDDTAASGAKLKPGDMILKVQREDIHTVAELQQRLKKMTEDGDRRVLIYAKGQNGARWTTLPLRL